MCVDRNSLVGMATRYWLDGPGIECRWSEIFRACPDRPWNPPSLLYNGYRVIPGDKAAGVVALTTHYHLVLRLMKQQSCTSTYLLGLHGLFQGELIFFLHLNFHALLRCDCVFCYCLSGQKLRLFSGCEATTHVVQFELLLPWPSCLPSLTSITIFIHRGSPSFPEDVFFSEMSVLTRLHGVTFRKTAQRNSNSTFMQFDLCKTRMYVERDSPPPPRTVLPCHYNFIRAPY